DEDGRSRVAAGHEQLSVRSAGTSVRPPTDRKSSGVTAACVSLTSRVSYFAVFDGHGGARASRFTAENLHHNLAKKFPSGETENLDKLIKKCLLDTFRLTDEEFLKKASSQKPAWKDGSTATCLLVVDDTVYVANLGDSRVSWE
uniref:Integrin-linked kinase-associated serine/threonine phosphatase n=1 Tax=Sparus aurata TaxID=8175 RepID=A0A671TVA9_SPAAU